MNQIYNMTIEYLLQNNYTTINKDSFHFKHMSV